MLASPTGGRVSGSPRPATSDKSCVASVVSTSTTASSEKAEVSEGDVAKPVAAKRQSSKSASGSRLPSKEMPVRRSSKGPVSRQPSKETAGQRPQSKEDAGSKEPAMPSRTSKSTFAAPAPAPASLDQRRPSVQSEEAGSAPGSRRPSVVRAKVISEGTSATARRSSKGRRNSKGPHSHSQHEQSKSAPAPREEPREMKVFIPPPEVGVMRGQNTELRKHFFSSALERQEERVAEARKGSFGGGKSAVARNKITARTGSGIPSANPGGHIREPLKEQRRPSLSSADVDTFGGFAPSDRASSARGRRPSGDGLISGRRPSVDRDRVPQSARTGRRPSV
eukprot:TRINITY_DN81596_c0_g1_i1.p1 TRINITY_DN81596_c0_g1~~TRINITY_DN81596_c0_g1_i1.p1  ORF type:complete len:337 (+),score=62.45 TRINITY_DN81596_c0_g1_i1:124-1134(+)